MGTNRTVHFIVSSLFAFTSTVVAGCRQDSRVGSDSSLNYALIGAKPIGQLQAGDTVSICGDYANIGRWALSKWLASSTTYSGVQTAIGCGGNHVVYQSTGTTPQLCAMYSQPANCGVVASTTGNRITFGPRSTYHTFVHEMGHALGLGHSQYQSAVMYAYENGVTNLTTDDAQGFSAAMSLTDDGTDDTAGDLPPAENGVPVADSTVSGDLTDYWDDSSATTQD